MSRRDKRKMRRAAIQVTRIASRELGVRSGVFLRKLQTEDADARMAFYVAAEQVAVDDGIDPDDIDLTWFQELLDMILEFIEKLMAIFDNFDF